MGNEPSRQDNRALTYSVKGPGGGDGEFADTILPPMVLIVDAILWRPDCISPSRDFDDNVSRSRSGRQLTPPASATSHSSRIWCTASLDGMEIYPPMSFPLPPMSVGGPMKVIPQTPNSAITLAFQTEAGAKAEIRIPLTKLIRYGAPLFTTLWLGLPLEGGTGYQYELSEALHRGQMPDVPKVAVTVFRPARNQDFHGLAVDPQPDVQCILVEDMDTCTGPVKKGPTAQVQIKGLVRALRFMSLTTHALQQKLFDGDNPDHGMATISRQLQDTLLNLTPKTSEREPSSAFLGDQIQAAEARARSAQEMHDELRRLNTKLEVEKAELDQRLQLQTEHWKQQQESASAEVQALRDTDGLRRQELDRALQELDSFHDLRLETEKNQADLDKATGQVEELSNLRSQVQTHRGQQLYLQRELTLATEELQSLRALEGQRKSLTQDHAQAQDELVRTKSTLAGEQKELERAREELKNLPGLSQQAQYLEAELKLAREKIDVLATESRDTQQELARAKATSETLTIEKEATTRMLEDQSARLKEELEAFRARDVDKPARDEDVARTKVELEALQREKEQWREDLDSECQRWNSELDNLRIANERQVDLQQELAQKSIELEVLRRDANNQKAIHDQIVNQTNQIEVRNKVEDEVLKDTVDKLRAAAPQRLKDLRAECEALREKDKERIALKEELSSVRMSNMRQLDEIKDLKEASRKTENKLSEVGDEFDRKKSELLNMRAEREVLRSGDLLRQELVDENLNMREELDKLRAKDGNGRKDLQDQLARACEELNVLRAGNQHRNDDESAKAAAWAKQKSDPAAVVTV